MSPPVTRGRGRKAADTITATEPQFNHTHNDSPDQPLAPFPEEQDYQGHGDHDVQQQPALSQLALSRIQGFGWKNIVIIFLFIVVLIYRSHDKKMHRRWAECEARMCGCPR